jgi:uncharacterized membrane protein YdjX (TVP38/TMEM64 family)
MSSSAEPVEKKKLPLAKLAVAVGIVALIGLVVLYLVGWRTALDEALRLKTAVVARMSAAGPVVFFSAMALLPSFGVPNSPFALAAGPVFGERLGLPVVTLLGFAAITFNLTLTYWLARRWLRPLCARLLERFGYRLPLVESGDVTDLIVLIRVTPVLPFFVQNYMLGLADVPFVRYLLISAAIQGSISVAFILFGDALNHGQGKMALTAALLIAMLAVGTHLLRKHYGEKKAVGVDADGGRKARPTAGVK